MERSHFKDTGSKSRIMYEVSRKIPEEETGSESKIPYKV